MEAFLKGLLGLILVSSTAFQLVNSQGKMELSTSKQTYAYAESIEVRMRVWNDTTVAFVLRLPSGSNPYWLLDSVTFAYWVGFWDREFTFNPGDSKTWVWRLYPPDLGIPNIEARHLVSGICGRFDDTVGFEAPMIRAGPLGVTFRYGMPKDQIDSLRRSVGGTVEWEWADTSGTFVHWRIEGFQVDSLATALTRDPRVVQAWVPREFPFVTEFIVSGVSDEHIQPKQVSLEQNFPNPFNPSTTIKYELPSGSHVTLSVYDMLGREVSVLVNERRDAGVHEVKFDASGLSSGVYFYRLTAGSFVQTRKLLLLR
jgi:hypothetical protein